MPLPWFRSRKASAEPAPPAAVQPTAEPETPLAPVTTAEPAATPGEQTEQTQAVKKRRRGSRGGRGRKRKPVGDAVAGTEAKPERAALAVAARGERNGSDRSGSDRSGSDRSGSDRGGSERSGSERAGSERGGSERTGSERKGRERSARPSRRSAPRRAPLPKAKRELLISVDPGEKRVAVLEDGVVAEVYLERPEQHSIAGNIYLGTVDNVLPGMEAAFVEIGLEKNGFLYVDEIVGPELEGRRGARKIQDLIQRGQSILVQAVKDPMKTKGARLTTEISLPGRFVVYVPHGDGFGVSRRLEDDERNRLKAIVKEIAPAKGGVIVRTAAEGASAEDVARDLEFLCRLWQTIETEARKATAPALIYQEAELPLRVTRDLFTGDFERLLVDHDRTYKRIVGYLKKTSPHMVDRVTRYREREPLLEQFGVEQEIRSTLNRRVDLPSGGYLIFDYAEAFTVIDVNTGRFVGSRSKRNGPGRLEDTITKNNLEAVKEVVRQLRLRDVGGIIVIDFIDMANPKNRQQVEDALRQELERDRTKTYVVEISPLGLVEMTRQNVTDGPREVMTRKCPTCGGDGIVVSEGTAAADVERSLRRLVTPGSRSKALKVEVNAKIANLLVGPGASRLHELEELTKRRFFFVASSEVPVDHVRVLEQGTVEKLAPAAPVELDQELDLRLGEVGLYDPHAGVGKVKGFDVIVSGASRLVGKRVRVKVEAVMDGVAFASLVGEEVASEAPITAEAEAERPTRARRTTRKADEADAVSEVEIEVDEEIGEVDDEVEDAEPVVKAPRKRAPRRSAKTAAAATTETEAETETETGAEPAEAGEAEVGEDGEPVADGAAPPRKRTRRGTRGGRNRKRKPVVASEDGAGEPISDLADDDASAPEADEPESPAPVEQPTRTRTRPVIHVPEPELGRNGDEPGESGSDTAPSRPRTRRGSRGGRARRKPAVVASSEANGSEQSANEAVDGEPDVEHVDHVEQAEQAVHVDQAEEAEHDSDVDEAVADEDASEQEADETVGAGAPAASSPDEWEYTPMSEWEAD